MVELQAGQVWNILEETNSLGRPGRNQPFPSAAINGPLGTLSWHFKGRRLSEDE